MLFYSLKRCLDAAGDGGLHLIYQSSSSSAAAAAAAAAHTDGHKYFNKDGIHGECRLILSDARSNKTTKYGTNLFIFRLLHKREDCNIDTTRRNFYHITRHPTHASSMLLVSIPPLVQIPWVPVLAICEHAFFSPYSLGPSAGNL